MLFGAVTTVKGTTKLPGNRQDKGCRVIMGGNVKTAYVDSCAVGFCRARALFVFRSQESE